MSNYGRDETLDDDDTPTVAESVDVPDEPDLPDNDDNDDDGDDGA